MSGSLNKILRLNQTGSAFLYAIAAMAIMLSISAVLMVFSYRINKQTKMPRIKSAMASIEGKIRATLMSPSSYSNCVSDATLTQGARGRAVCQLNTLANGLSILTALDLPESDIAVENIISNNNFVDPRTGLKIMRITADVTYKAKDFPVKPLRVEVDVPSDILQAAKYTCPISKPIFRSFTTDGVPNCNPIPSKCGPGTYARKIDLYTLVPECLPLPAAIQCPDSQKIISEMHWVAPTNPTASVASPTARATISFNCVPRLNPYVVQQYDPLLNALIVNDGP